MDFRRLKKFAQRSVSESSAGEEKTPSPKTPPSPFSHAPSPSPTPPSNLKPTNRAPRPLRNTSPLPTDPSLLEGLLNHHASQLKKLADRVESVNEWIEMDGIVLARLLSDLTLKIEKADNADAVPPLPSTPRNRVHFKAPEGHDADLSIEERVSSNGNIRDARERIRSMKKWRKELERSVYWQREEYARIEKAMGKQKGEGEVAEEAEGVGGGAAWGVGGKTWEKGSGRLPTQVEWEVMFGSQRLRWDEKGARPGF